MEIRCPSGKRHVAPHRSEPPSVGRAWWHRCSINRSEYVQTDDVNPHNPPVELQRPVPADQPPAPRGERAQPATPDIGYGGQCASFDVGSRGDQACVVGTMACV